MEAEMLYAIDDQNVEMVDNLWDQLFTKQKEVDEAADVVHQLSYDTNFEKEEQDWRAEFRSKFKKLIQKLEKMQQDFIDSSDLRYGKEKKRVLCVSKKIIYLCCVTLDLFS